MGTIKQVKLAARSLSDRAITMRISVLRNALSLLLKHERPMENQEIDMNDYSAVKAQIEAARAVAESAIARRKREIELLIGKPIEGLEDGPARFYNLLTDTDRETQKLGIIGAGRYLEPNFLVFSKLVEFILGNDKSLIVLSIDTLGDWYKRTKNQDILDVLLKLRERYVNDKYYITTVDLAIGNEVDFERDTDYMDNFIMKLK